MKKHSSNHKLLSLLAGMMLACGAQTASAMTVIEAAVWAANGIANGAGAVVNGIKGGVNILKKKMGIEPDRAEKYGPNGGQMVGGDEFFDASNKPDKQRRAVQFNEDVRVQEFDDKKSRKEINKEFNIEKLKSDNHNAPIVKQNYSKEELSEQRRIERMRIQSEMSDEERAKQLYNKQKMLGKI